MHFNNFFCKNKREVEREGEGESCLSHVKYLDPAFKNV
jgi:hypothetical protein